MTDGTGGQSSAAARHVATAASAARASVSSHARHRMTSSEHAPWAAHTDAAGSPERAGTPWRREGGAHVGHHVDVQALVGAGVPLTLLMDLADPSGPDSSAIYWGEPTVGGEAWIR